MNNINNCDILELAKKIREDKKFINDSNVSFYDMIYDSVAIRTYERWVENFSLACGTAAGSTGVLIL